ncbi:MAG: GAF domain-containing protein [Candidatus Omnitrophica bacterium]|nr:GAF domain-containing protein [Candidatus Omnitrophota bacterium]
MSFGGMNLFVLSSAFGALMAVATSVFLLVRAPSDSVRNSYIRVVLCTGGWTSFPWVVSLAPSHESALWLARGLYVSALFAGPAFMEFSLKFVSAVRVEYRARWSIWISYSAGCLMIPLVFREDFLTGVSRYQPYFSLHVGPAFWFFAIFFAANCMNAFVQLLKVYRVTSGLRRVQIKYVFVAYFFAFIAALIHFASCLGVPEVFPHDILVVFCMILIAYTIVRHQLMDIEVVIRRATVFAGLFTFVYGVVALFVLLGRNYFEEVLRWPSWAAIIPTICVITLTIRPLESWLIRVTDRFLFQKKYDYKELLKLFNSEVLTLLDLKQIAENTVQSLSHIVKLESCGVGLLDVERHAYDVVATIGFQWRGGAIPYDDPLLVRLRQNRAYELRIGTHPQQPETERMRMRFAELNADLVLAIVFHGELIGFISLGSKKSGEPYNAEDLAVLSSLAHAEGIAISNARLFAQLAQTQAEAAQNEKMAVIGTLAAGINHEICNPLGIIRGQCEVFLLNFQEGIYDQLSDKEVIANAARVMQKVIKETDRATGITKRLSTFAKPPKYFKADTVDLRNEVGEVLAILEHEMRVENIRVDNMLPESFPKIKADRKQVQEVIFNIIRNAAQAIADEGEIRIEGSRNGTHAEIQIRDNGRGIPADKIDKIFNPFFTTKEPGKGTGLGLFIVKQIVERNKGRITVESRENEGTVFRLKFEIAEMVPEAAVRHD